MMVTHCSWKHVEEGLKKTDLLTGIILSSDAIKEIVFTLPNGDKVTVPKDSKLEIRIDGHLDDDIPF